MNKYKTLLILLFGLYIVDLLAMCAMVISVLQISGAPSWILSINDYLQVVPPGRTLVALLLVFIGVSLQTAMKVAYRWSTVKPEQM